MISKCEVLTLLLYLIVSAYPKPAIQQRRSINLSSGEPSQPEHCLISSPSMSAVLRLLVVQRPSCNKIPPRVTRPSFHPRKDARNHLPARSDACWSR
ncbi:hypothetical protein EV126DRAFT_418155 [Verticillium dahliae]|nr:hypothetical protein EV126DRAFT_418155 [Verticillium dahliae]